MSSYEKHASYLNSNSTPVQSAVRNVAQPGGVQQASSTPAKVHARTAPQRPAMQPEARTVAHPTRTVTTTYHSSVKSHGG